MKGDMTVGFFEQTDYGKIALDKMAPVPENFRLHKVGHSRAPHESMEVTGAEFRHAKSGVNKGKLCIIIAGTKKTTYVTSKEILDSDYEPLVPDVSGL